MKRTVAIYPGTFDPLTLGHGDIMRKASELFDSVVIAVAASAGKRPVFSLEERVEIAAHEASRYDNVRVFGFSGMLKDFVQERGGHVIVRGLRAMSDFDYEFQMAGMNRMLMPDVETIFLTPAENYQFISGTIVREIALLGGDVSKFVSGYVEGRLREKVASMGKGR